jgi:hypothetical protein
MKKLLITIAAVASLYQAEAQTVTNIAFRVTVETVTAGVTNSVNSTVRYEGAGSEQDVFAVNGLAVAYAKNVEANGVNAPTFPVFLRQDIRDQVVRPYSKAAQDAAKKALAVDTIPTIIANQWENLTQQQKNQLAAIAAAFPNP